MKLSKFIMVGAMIASLTVVTAFNLPNFSSEGLVEFEVGVDIDDAEDTTTSTLTNTKVELAFEASLEENIKATAVLQYSEDDNITVDSASIMFCEKGYLPTFGVVRDAVSFGSYETSFISDALTQELSESSNSHFYLGKTLGNLGLSASIFNGRSEIEGDEDDLFDSYTFSANYAQDFNSFSFSAGASYMNNFMETNFAEESLEVETYSIPDRVGAYAGWLAIAYQKATLHVEYFSTLEELESENLAIDETDLNGLEPQVLTAEIGYALTEKLSFSSRYETTSNVENILPETKIGLNSSWTVKSNETSATTLALEFTNSTYKNDDEKNQLLLQLGFTF